MVLSVLAVREDGGQAGGEGVVVLDFIFSQFSFIGVFTQRNEA